MQGLQIILFQRFPIQQKVIIWDKNSLRWVLYCNQFLNNLPTILNIEVDFLPAIFLCAKYHCVHVVHCILFYWYCQGDNFFQCNVVFIYMVYGIYSCLNCFLHLLNCMFIFVTVISVSCMPYFFLSIHGGAVYNGSLFLRWPQQWT